jgi:hypothetical protein
MVVSSRRLRWEWHVACTWIQSFSWKSWTCGRLRKAANGWNDNVKIDIE